MVLWGDYYGTVSGCYSTGSVSGGWCVGGLVEMIAAQYLSVIVQVECRVVVVSVVLWGGMESQ